ncbi:MAG TPA: recombinase family protein [Thermoanaerobaculia bacterium]|nr:recombinase family protein [Thermoanaerobaculia bacterium]
MSLTALLYARASAVDPAGALAERQVQVRAAAAARGWRVAGEHWDEVRTLIGRRPGLVGLTAAVRKGGVDVVVCPSLPNLFRDLRHLVYFGGELLERHVEVLALEEPFDTTNPTQRPDWIALSHLGVAFAERLHSEAVHLGRRQAAARAAGTWGQPPKAVNPLELAGYWHGTRDRRPLSTREIAPKLGVSHGTVATHIRELLAAGTLNPELRAKHLETHGGLRKGGRPVNKRRAK